MGFLIREEKKEKNILKEHSWMLKFTKFQVYLENNTIIQRKKTRSITCKGKKITDTYNKLINKYHERRNDFNLDLKEKMEMDVLISLLKELKNLGP